jgi:D-alanyl-lipoteichoic acid acyltransferase DltB (MBOAT superfamily)
LNALWAASPAEFWRRWNRPVQEWLFEYVFRPIAGAGRTGAATVAAFAASGILHEYIVAMASGRITGYPTAFFLVQSLGVLTTSRWEPRGWRRVLGVASTWAFNAVTSVLLFAPLGAATPFYVNEVPRWARLW